MLLADEGRDNPYNSEPLCPLSIKTSLNLMMVLNKKNS
jgi:hypothetical protein